MMRGLICALALLCGAAGASAQTTVVILVRHAEQDAAAGQDPPLSAAGRARADSLVRALRGAGISAIYHTQFRRTTETAKVAADSLHVPTTEFATQAGQAPQQHAAALAADVLARHKGRTVLVVGHSNTVPLIAAALGASDPPRIADTEYFWLYVVVKREGEPARLLVTRYSP
jgi:broad specificity phosphatase PhoE